MSDFNFTERAPTVSSSNAKVAIDRIETQRTYPVVIEEPEDLYGACKEILGYTDYGPTSDGRLRRTPPKADPAFTMCFADSIPQIRGIGIAEQTSANPDMEVPPIGDFSFYPYYDFTVNYVSRQYNVLPDSDITVSDGSWWPDVNSDSSSAQQFFKWPNEWTRYTEMSPPKFAGDYLTQQGSTLAGTMVFQATVGPTSNQTCAFLPSVRVPNFHVSITWRGIPYRYITSKNSYIASKNWQNRVNQTP